jgi:hypothetical protein
LFQASLSAAQTLAFIEPDTAFPRFVERIGGDIDSSRLEGVTATDLGIWKTEEGVAYIDGQFNLFL